MERIYTKQKTRFAREFSIQFVTIGTIPVVRVPAGKIPFINSGSFPVETVPAGKIPFLTVGTFPFSSVGTFPRGHFQSKLRVKFLWGQFHPKLRGKFLLSKFILVKLTVGENSVYKIFVGKSPST